MKKKTIFMALLPLFALVTSCSSNVSSIAETSSQEDLSVKASEPVVTYSEAQTDESSIASPAPSFEEEELVEEEQIEDIPVQEEIHEEPVIEEVISEEDIFEEEMPTIEPVEEEETLPEVIMPQEEVEDEETLPEVIMPQGEVEDEETLPEPVISQDIVEEPEGQVETPTVEQTSEEEAVNHNKAVKTDTFYKVVRTSEARINDLGRILQPYDVVYPEFEYNELIAAGYKYFDITITFEAREYYDGYQHIFLYNTSKTQGVIESSFLGALFPSIRDGKPEGLLVSRQFELTSGSRQTNWTLEKWHVRITISSLIDNIWIRYGASGILADDWGNRNVTISMTPIESY